MGLIYLAWELIFIYSKIEDLRWSHNFVYSIIFITVGIAWYHESIASRSIATIQAFMLPVTSSGSVNTFVMTFITTGILVTWMIIVLIERKKGQMFLKNSVTERTWRWINMHTLVIAWLLIAHMGLVFIIGRVPQEAQLRILGLLDIGVLTFLPPEIHEVATWAFDISLFIWAIIVIYEQFKLGYNLQNKPWPRWSFWWTFVTMAAGLIGLGIGALFFPV